MQPNILYTDLHHPIIFLLIFGAFEYFAYLINTWDYFVYVFWIAYKIIRFLVLLHIALINTCLCVMGIISIPTISNASVYIINFGWYIFIKGTR
jgi:hypothetical protein